MSANPVIETRDLNKSFPSGAIAVNGLQLSVAPGSVYGLIGRNGAGKTTTLRLLMGLLQPDRGEARILGKSLWTAPRHHRQRIAYVSQAQQAPDWMTLEELCRYSRHFYCAWDADLARHLIHRWELPPRLAIGRMSGGQQRLAALVIGLAVRPSVLLLDEPAAGLDPIARHALNECLLEALLRGDGCTILLSTHLIADLERLATHVAIMDRGRLVAEGEVDDWQQHLRRVQVICDPGIPGSAGRIEVPGCLRSESIGAVTTAIARLPDESALDHLRVRPGTRVQIFPLSLEEVFVELFRQAQAGSSVSLELESFGQPGAVAGIDPIHRVGGRSGPAVAPAEQERD